MGSQAGLGPTAALPGGVESNNLLILKTGQQSLF